MTKGRVFVDIAILLYDRMTALDAIGPYEVLGRVPGATLAFVSPEPGTKRTDQKLGLVADTSLADSLGLGIPRPAKQKKKLTPREAEVHELVAQGLTNEEIAKLLYISLSTVKVHVKHIYEKLSVRSRLEAARALRDDV